MTKAPGRQVQSPEFETHTERKKEKELSHTYNKTKLAMITFMDKIRDHYLSPTLGGPKDSQAEIGC